MEHTAPEGPSGIYVALKFREDAEARRAASAYNRDFPDSYLAVPDSATVVISAARLAEFRQTLKSMGLTSFNTYPVRSFADLAPEEAAKRRRRGLIPNSELATEEGRVAVRKEIEEQMRR